MRRINLTIDGKRYEQVSKPTARKLFAQGREIYLNSCNLMPGNVWQSLCRIKLDEDLVKMKKELYAELKADNLEVTTRYGDTPEKQFNETVNEFENYNCDSERGKYANYFIKVDL